MSILRSPVPLVLMIVPAVLLAGCGGGGGGGGYGGSSNQTYLGSFSGKIVDTSGNPVASAVLLLDNNQLGPASSNSTAPAVAGGASFSQGGYEILNVTPGFHTIGVSTTVNGVTYTGSTQDGLPNIPHNAVTNANIIVSPNNEQATVSGYVSANGQPVGGARVYFQSNFAAPNTQSSPPSGLPTTDSLVAITESNGYYQINNLPVQDTGTGGARQYVITASYQTLSPQNSLGNASPVQDSFTAGQNVTNLNFSLPPASGSGSSTSPALNYIQAFTQPDIPPSSTAHAVTAGGSGSVYTQIREALSPEYAQLLAHGRAAKITKRLGSALSSHATASQYTVEMDMFFSLPNDTVSTPDPVRGELSGFEINSNALSHLGGTIPYDYLQDPLANFYDDPDLGTVPVYVADTQYQFNVQSVAADGVTLLGQSNTASAAPLSFVNLSEPEDPSSQNGTVSILSPNSSFQWSTIDPNTNASNYRVGAYYVYVYSSYPGVSTTPVAVSNQISGSQDTYPVPTSLTAGHEYWLVVAAVSSDSTSQSSAISVSQIDPFYVQ